MKLIAKDSIKIISFVLAIILIIFSLKFKFLAINIPDNFIIYLDEVLTILPFYMIIWIGYKAVLRISYNIIFINDCKTEHKELLEELEIERNKLKSKGLL